MTDSSEAVPLKETEVILGDPDILHLDGLDIDIKVEQLRTRQLFKFLKILTVGAGAALADLSISAETDSSELAQELIAILLISIPEAENEVMEFLNSMIAPVDLIEPERSKDDHAANVEKYTKLYREFNNPLPGDTISLLVRIVQNEAPNLLALGKQIAALLPTAAKLTNSSKKPSKKSTPAAS